MTDFCFLDCYYGCRKSHAFNFCFRLQMGFSQMSAREYYFLRLKQNNNDDKDDVSHNINNQHPK